MLFSVACYEFVLVIFHRDLEDIVFRIFIIFSVLTLLPVDLALACEKIPHDLRKILSKGSDLILVGELHGTNESPAKFYDIVCNLENLTSRKITVAFEFQDKNIMFLNGYNDLLDGVKSSSEWKLNHDGKTSVAMYELLQRIRALSEKNDLEVMFFDGEGDDRELLLAKNIYASVSNDRIVVVFTGNRHNQIKHGNVWDEYSKNMGAYLTEMNVDLVSINLIHTGGKAWVCMDDCGIHEFKGVFTESEFFKANEQSRYQYHWNIGPITYSVPMVRL
ncbi:hypothetical protein [Shewanella sp. GXUN23E]|uniref:hypothetical protein n=1 Tax=Shewanella sp. GXUN23E TaxID=3422498 RepID=UPI003D7C36C4